MIGALSNTPHPAKVSRSFSSPAANQELFQQMLQQAMDVKNSSLKGEEKIGLISQIATKAIEELKKKHVHILDDEPTEGEAESVSSAANPGKGILRGVVEENGVSPRKNTGLKDLPSGIIRKFDPENRLMAQLPTAQQPQQRVVQNNGLIRRRPGAVIANTPNGKISVTPFQIFLDKAMDFFEMVSDLENPSDTMTQDFVEGKVSMEELALIKAKVGVAISFAMTMVNQVTQTFKEIQNMQV